MLRINPPGVEAPFAIPEKEVERNPAIKKKHKPLAPAVIHQLKNSNKPTIEVSGTIVPESDKPPSPAEIHALKDNINGQIDIIINNKDDKNIPVETDKPIDYAKRALSKTTPNNYEQLAKLVENRIPRIRNNPQELTKAYQDIVKSYSEGANKPIEEAADIVSDVFNAVRYKHFQPDPEHAVKLQKEADAIYKHRVDQLKANNYGPTLAKPLSDEEIHKLASNEANELLQSNINWASTFSGNESFMAFFYDEEQRKHSDNLNSVLLQHTLTESNIEHRVDQFNGQVLIKKYDRAGREVWSTPNASDFGAIKYESGTIAGAVAGSIGGLYAGSKIGFASGNVPGAIIGGAGGSLSGGILGGYLGRKLDYMLFLNNKKPLDMEIEKEVKAIHDRNVLWEEAIFGIAAPAAIKLIGVTGKFGARALGIKNSTGIRAALKKELMDEKLAGLTKEQIKSGKKAIDKQVEKEIDEFLVGARLAFDAAMSRDVMNLFGIIVPNPLSRTSDDYLLSQHKKMLNLYSLIQQENSTGFRGRGVLEAHSDLAETYKNIAESNIDEVGDLDVKGALDSIARNITMTSEAFDIIVSAMTSKAGSKINVQNTRKQIQEAAAIIHNHRLNDMSVSDTVSLLNNSLETAVDYSADQMNPIRILNLIRTNTKLDKTTKQAIIEEFRERVLYNEDITSPKLRAYYKFMDAKTEYVYNSTVRGASKALLESISNYLNTKDNKALDKLLQQLMGDDVSNQYGLKNVVYTAMASRLLDSDEGYRLLKNYESKLIRDIFAKWTKKLPGTKSSAFDYSGLIRELNNLNFYSKEAKDLKNRLIQSQKAFNNMDIHELSTIMTGQKTKASQGISTNIKTRLYYWWMAGNLTRVGRNALDETIGGKEGKKRIAARLATNILGNKRAKMNLSGKVVDYDNEIKNDPRLKSTVERLDNVFKEAGDMPANQNTRTVKEMNDRLRAYEMLEKGNFRAFVMHDDHSGEAVDISFDQDKSVSKAVVISNDKIVPFDNRFKDNNKWINKAIERAQQQGIAYVEYAPGKIVSVENLENIGGKNIYGRHPGTVINKDELMDLDANCRLTNLNKVNTYSGG